MTRRTTPAWDAIHAIVQDWHGEFCMSGNHDCDVEIDRQTTELYDAVAEEQR